jgi:hypothetical protein
MGEQLMQCTKCHKEAEKLTAAGICFDCEFERQTAEVERERKTITVDQLFAAIENASGPDEIGTAFGQCEPPTDAMEQEVLRERLVRALAGKVKRPGAFVDAWLKRAPSADELARIAKDATLLVRLALAHAVLFHDRSQEPYALIEAGGHKETHRVGSRYFKRWLSKLYYEDANAKPERTPDEDDSMLAQLFGAMQSNHSPVPNAQALRDALLQLEGLALFEGEEHEVHVRIAQLGEHLYLDLADEAWRAVEITRTSWKVIDAPPVRFIRPDGMLPLPEPAVGGKLSKLREFLNVSDDDWPLVAGYEVGLTRPRGPYTVLELLGEQGSAKSSAGRFIRRIVDPYSPLDRGQPRSEHDLVIAASRQWVMSYDNLSWLPDWLSDAFARISTGGGFGARALYTDDEERRFDAMRPIILNGIEDLASRGDLLDRAIIVTLQPIEDEDRKEESELEAEFLQAWPKLLGAVLDATVTALTNIGNVKIDRLPRMADFTVWVVAAEPSLGIEEGAFLKAYRRNRQEANAVALEASLVAVEVQRFMDVRETWDGIATDLLRALNEIVDEDVKALKEWPKTGRGLSGKLRRLAPGLRRSGIRLEFDRVGHGGTRTITVTRTQPVSHEVGEQPSPSSPSSPPDGDDADGADGRSHTPSPPQRVRVHPEGIGHGDEAALELLKSELGATDSEALDYIDRRRLEGVDFTTITAGLKQAGFPPPPGRATWDLATTVMAYGIRHP